MYSAYCQRSGVLQQRYPLRTTPVAGKRIKRTGNRHSEACHAACMATYQLLRKVSVRRRSQTN